MIVFGNGFSHFVLMVDVSVRGADVVDLIREKEKAYYADQENPDVVQPYAAYGPAGHTQVPYMYITGCATSIKQLRSSYHLRYRRYKHYKIVHQSRAFRVRQIGLTGLNTCFFNLFLRTH